MIPRHHKIAFLSFLFLLFGHIAIAQCSDPLLKAFTNQSLHSVQVNKLEIDDALPWQIKYAPKYDQSLIITTDTIFENEYLIESLLSGTEYAVFARDVCEETVGDWNGPFHFTTVLNNPSACGLKLDIEDYNCPTGETFFIDIQGFEDDILGEDVFLSNVKLIIDHKWPTDLSIDLISPSGVSVKLSENIGINQKHYGDPFDLLCKNVVRFDMSACHQIEQEDGELIGSYIPIGDFEDFYDNTSPNGIWKLKICDKGQGDLGQLKFIKLKFSPIICEIPKNIGLQTVTDTSFTIKWDNASICNRVIIETGPKGFTIGQNNIVLFCDETDFIIDGLEPDTEYEYILHTNCIDEDSPRSCRYLVKTNCAKSSFVSTFDNLEPCPSSCIIPCPITDQIWNNIDVEGEDDMDWIVNSNHTISDNTGPENDLFITGNYLYIENSETLCGIQSKAILQSSCMMVNSSLGGCDMSFYTHMVGADINKLALLFSSNNLESWDTIKTIIGEQESGWQEQSIDLADYDQKAGVFRIVAWSGSNEFGDIAIDNISFFGSEIISESIIYYLDDDNDGFGDINITTNACDIHSPVGYVSNNLDCDDNDENINPNAVEIHCNLIDENCNGNEDDQPTDNPLSYDFTGSQNEFCDGQKNGYIEIYGIGGTPPYTYEWNDGSTNKRISNIGAGTYMCTITDSEFCELETNPIHLYLRYGFEPTFNITSPSCVGVLDGSIELTNHFGIGPFSYLWSNGSIDSLIENIESGVYWFEITNDVCTQRDTIILDAPQLISTDITINNISCRGNDDATIKLNTYEGKSPFKYEWNTGQTEDFIYQLSSQAYNCTIEDDDGCKLVIDSINITEPDSLKIRVDLIDHITCFGQKNGHIMVSALGGTKPYFFNWTNNYFTNNLDSLSAGLYDLTVTDNNFCKAYIENIEIIEKQPIEISLDSLHPVSCLSSNDGYISVNVTGGAGDYTYFWEQSDLDTSILDGLTYANYQLRVIDRFDCKVAYEVDVPLLNIPLEIDLQLATSNLCHDDTIAKVICNLESGRSPFVYHWNTGKITNTDEPLDSLEHLSSGVLQVTITDGNGCIGISEILTLEQIMPLNYSIDEWNDISCFGANDGGFNIHGVGGTDPYKYLWNTEDQTNFVSNLSPGNYQFTITDDNDCTITSPNLPITEPDAINLIINIDYNMQAITADINIIANGGNPPYLFEWDDDFTQTDYFSDRTDLSIKDYKISITDADNCTIDTIITVSQILAINDNVNSLELNISPNPNQGSFYIISNNNESIDADQLILRNVYGQMILNKIFKSNHIVNNTLVTLKSMNNQILFIELRKNNQTIFLDKLLIQN